MLDSDPGKEAFISLPYTTVGTPTLRALEQRRKRKRPIKRLVTREESESIQVIMYQDGEYWAVLQPGGVLEQVILASIKRGNNIFEQVQFITAVDVWCQDHPGLHLSI